MRIRRRGVASAALAVAAGLCLGLANPPLGVWPAVFLPVPLLLTALALDSRHAQTADRRPRAFRFGMLAGIAAFAPMLTWLIAPAGPVAWLLLFLVQGVYLGLFALLSRPWIGSRWAPLVIPVIWTGIDAWRGRFPLGGFDWGSLAYAHTDGSWMLPAARIIGARGLTLMTAAIGVLVFAVIRVGLETTDGLEGSAWARLQSAMPHLQRPLIILVGVLALTVLVTVEPPGETGGQLDVLAVQGNDLRGFTGSFQEEDATIAAKHRDLTIAAVASGGQPDLTIWPENAVDRDPYSERGSDLLPLVTESARTVGGNLLFGVDIDVDPRRSYRRQSILFDEAGEQIGAYTKRHLVPFGEFVPARSLIGDFPPLRQVPRDALAGEAPSDIEVAGTRVAVNICFETLFPEIVRSNLLATDPQGAGLLVMTTNDNSFGDSAEPAQHLAQSRLRAIETGRWVVHASISGSSAFIDPDGRITQATPLFTATTIRADLPLVSGLTPFLATGDVVSPASRVLVLLAALWWLILARRRPVRPAASDPSTLSTKIPAETELV